MMNDWKAIVKSVAPVLGAALGGPMAGAGVKFLADSLLGNSGATEQDVAEAVLSASPDRLIELRSLDNEFKQKMRELDVDVFKLEVADKDSARQLAKVNMVPHIMLSGLFIGGYFFILYAMLTGEFQVPAESKAEASMVLGVLTAGVTMIMQFWFGSSMGSKEKTHAMVAK